MPPAKVWQVDPLSQQWSLAGSPQVEIPTEDRVLGEFKPSTSNTALAYQGIAEADLEVRSGNVTFGSADNGKKIEGYKFTGTVTVTGRDINLDRCAFRPIDTGSGSQITAINCDNDSVRDLVVSNSYLRPTNYSYRMYSIFGRGYTLEYSDCSGFVDTSSLVGKNASSVDLNINLWGNIFHDQYYGVPDLNQGDRYTHNDGSQIHFGGKNIDIFGNTYTGTCDVAISSSGAPTYNGSGVIQSGNRYYPADPVPISWLMMSPQSAAAGMTNFAFRNNWAGGAVVGINWPRVDGTNIQIYNNKWGAPTYQARGGQNRVYVNMSAGQAMSRFDGNVMESDGTPWNVRYNA